LECATSIKQADADAEGKQMGLTVEEFAFYDALTKPSAIKDIYQNEELVAISSPGRQNSRGRSLIAALTNTPAPRFEAWGSL